MPYIKRFVSLLKSKTSKWILMPLAFKYLESDRSFQYKGLNVVVKKGVFHSGLFFSSAYVSEFLETLDLQGKDFLELGAGTGLISMVAARKGAIVTSIDINPDSIENLKINFHLNQLKSEILLSDFFSAIPDEKVFELIIITPPYYPKEPKSNAEKAWYCGENFEYFHRLFNTLKNRLDKSQCFMVLSEDCALDTIKRLALNSNIAMDVFHQKRFLWEKNYIFSLKIIAMP